MELDPKKLNERVTVAEVAIEGRLFDIRNDSDHHEERGLMADTQRTLKFLRKIK